MKVIVALILVLKEGGGGGGQDVNPISPEILQVSSDRYEAYFRH